MSHKNPPEFVVDLCFFFGTCALGAGALGVSCRCPGDMDIWWRCWLGSMVDMPFYWGQLWESHWNWGSLIFRQTMTKPISNSWMGWETTSWLKVLALLASEQHRFTRENWRMNAADLTVVAQGSPRVIWFGCEAEKHEEFEHPSKMIHTIQPRMISHEIWGKMGCLEQTQYNMISIKRMQGFGLNLSALCWSNMGHPPFMHDLSIWTSI